MLALILGIGHIVPSGNKPTLESQICRYEGQHVSNASLQVSTERIWVKVRSAISIKELAEKLAMDETWLARLNDVYEDHSFSSGDWLVLPSRSSNRVKYLAAIDSSEMRRSPPLAASSEPQEVPRVRFGDSLAKIANRYNLSISEPLRSSPAASGGVGL